MGTDTANKVKRYATVTAIGTLLALAALPAPAAADFHGICTGFATAYANVELVFDPSTGEMIYAGDVNCPSAVVTIKELALIHDSAMPDPVQLANTTGAPCVYSPCLLTDAVADVPTGTLEVSMVFDADDPATTGVDFPDVERSGKWLWLGDGQPVPICRSVGAFPVSVGEC